MDSPLTSPLAQGVHAVKVDGRVLSYHVYGTGLRHRAGVRARTARRVDADPGRARRAACRQARPRGRVGAFQNGNITDDESHVEMVRAVLPIYLADYWSDERYARTQSALEGTYVSGLDESGEPDAFDVRSALPTMEVPALVVVGRYDPICGMHWAEELHRLIPSSKLLVLGRSGHFGHLEEPELFAGAVAAFVAATATSVGA